MQKPQKMQIDSIKCKYVAEANEKKKNTENKDYFNEKNERLLRDMKSLRLVSRKKKEKYLII